MWKSFFLHSEQVWKNFFFSFDLPLKIYYFFFKVVQNSEKTDFGQFWENFFSDPKISLSSVQKSNPHSTKFCFLVPKKFFKNEEKNKNFAIKKKNRVNALSWTLVKHKYIVYNMWAEEMKLARFLCVFLMFCEYYLQCGTGGNRWNCGPKHFLASKVEWEAGH